jgi:hypothetical protein
MTLHKAEQEAIRLAGVSAKQQAKRITNEKKTFATQKGEDLIVFGSSHRLPASCQCLSRKEGSADGQDNTQEHRQSNPAPLRTGNGVYSSNYQPNGFCLCPLLMII